MRVIAIDKVKPGMVIARAVIGSKGEILLSRDVKIDEPYIKRIKEIGVPALYIRDENIGKVDYDDVISEQTRLTDDFGVERAAEVLKEYRYCEVPALLDCLTMRLMQFIGDREQSDDITFIILKAE